ncbi:MAG TPA: AMP-binding protein [Candidatus Elarobacter sp.]|nr:AMP-binding protein [Candidatus Elarobacter sp.]
MNVTEILAARAALHPRRVALADAASGRALTYGALDAASARAASALRARGLRPGEPVLILHPVSLELYAALIGLLRAGLVPAFPPPGATRGVLARCVREHPPHAVLAGGIGWAALGTIPSLANAVRLATSPAPFAYDVLRPRSSAGDAIAARGDDDPAMLTFTSGSTGAPKALARTHGVSRAQCDALGAALGLDETVSLCAMPAVLLAELAAGATCVLPAIDLRRPARADAALLAETLRAHRVERVIASPALLANLVAALRARGATLPALRTIASGGAPVMPPLAAALRAVAPNARVLAVYGSTEAEPISVLDATAIPAADLAAMREGAGLLAGTPCTPAAVAIAATPRGAVYGPFAETDAIERRMLAPYASGEILVAGPHVVTGYLDRAGDATTKVRAGARIWHRTGDLGYRDAQGRLWLTGRVASVVEDARGRVEPLRVECALSFLPEIARSALAGDDGTRVLVVEPAPNARIDERTIRAALPFAEIDRIVVAPVPVDPRHNAKVDYAALARLVRRYARAA